MLTDLFSILKITEWTSEPFCSHAYKYGCVLIIHLPLLTKHPAFSRSQLSAFAFVAPQSIVAWGCLQQRPADMIMGSNPCSIQTETSINLEKQMDWTQQRKPWSLYSVGRGVFAFGCTVFSCFGCILQQRLLKNVL